MVTVPVIKPSKAQLITVVAGAAMAALGYFFPQLLPAIGVLGKVLWPAGFFTGGVGAVQIVRAPKVGGP
jgi:hypothetical protein